MPKESIYSGQQLRRLRRMKDWTQGDLSLESGISEDRISRYEREGFPNGIAKKDIESLCNALGCEPARLEKPLLENIYQLGLGVAEDLLLSPLTDGKQHVALLKYLESQRSVQPGTGDTEQKDLTQIFQVNVGDQSGNKDS